MKNLSNYDVVIAGGGPAAVSAASLLGRNKRKVLLCDASHSDLEAYEAPERVYYCNSEFLPVHRTHLNRLECVKSLRASVEEVHREQTGFRIVCDNGTSCSTKSLLLASDFVAQFPAIPGAKQYFGVSLHQCPDCDGWEHRDQTIGVIGGTDGAATIALRLLTWTPKVTVYTHGGKLPMSTESRLRGMPVNVVTGSVRSLIGTGKQLEALRMENGSTYPCDALFFSATVKSHLHLATRIGSNLPQYVLLRGHTANWDTGIQGLFFTAEVNDGMGMVVSAAAEGVKAAEAILQWLRKADRSYLAKTSQHRELSCTPNSNAI
jgi:thioredoxin reductase